MDYGFIVGIFSDISFWEFVLQKWCLLYDTSHLLGAKEVGDNHLEGLFQFDSMSPYQADTQIASDPPYCPHHHIQLPRDSQIYAIVPIAPTRCIALSLSRYVSLTELNLCQMWPQ